MAAKVNSVRFVKMVEESGNPERAVLWVAPEKDAAFMKAVKDQRVVSVHEENVGSRKDFGVVGYKKGHGYLVFPKKLKAEEGAKVIGLKYDLLKSEPPDDPVPLVAPKKSKIKAPAGREHPQILKRKFRVVISGSIDFMVELEAEDAKQAQERAIDRVKTGKEDVRTLDMKLKAKSARKI